MLKVKCIDAQGTDYLVVGRMYEVEDGSAYDPSCYYIRGIGYWKKTRFVPPEDDSVVMPAHYARYPIEPVRFSMENKLGFAQGNIVKYVVRYDAKGGVEDLKKARRYLDMLIKQEEGNADFWKADAG